MVSRRKILSRSRDDLNLDQSYNPQEEEEDVWFQKDKLFKEHIQEVLDKWTQIDDEIWAKVIVFERNRRVAKAYARAPVLTINGSDDGFDGMRIGLCGFDNPMRDQKTEELKRHIGQGVKIKMDDAGNILIRRYAKSNVYVKSTASNANEETSIGADILKLPNQALESEKIVKLFDMKKFQSNVNRELRRAYPDRRRLETQCLSAVAFVKSENDILECPIWVLIVNVVAMDMLKSKLPPVQRPMVDIKNRPRIPIPDEDPYSVAGNGSGGSSGSSGFGGGGSSGNGAVNGSSNNNVGHLQSNGNGTVNSNGHNGNNLPNGSNGLGVHLNNGSGHVAATREQLLLQTQQLAHKRSEKPPKLPPRDNIYAHDIIPKPDYDDVDIESRIKLSRGKSDKGKDNKKYDDPYYCGLRARVPNFVKSTKTSSKDQRDHAATLNNGTLLSNGNGNGSISNLTQKKTSLIHMPHSAPLLHPVMHHSASAVQPHMHPMMHPTHAGGHHMHHHQMWQARSFESGIGIYTGNEAQQKQQQHQLHIQMTATPLTNAATTTTRNYFMDHNNNKNLLAPTTTTTATHNHALNSKMSSSSSSNSQQPHSLPMLPTMQTNMDNDLTTDRHINANSAPNTTIYGHNGHELERGLGLGLGMGHGRSHISYPLQIQQQHNSFAHHHHHHPHRHPHRHHSRNCSRRREGGEYASEQPQQQRLDESLYTPSTVSHFYDDPESLADERAILSTQARLSRSRTRYPPRELQQTLSPHRWRRPTNQIGSNCNCVSCYTLAPLFGATPLPRPSRSLSQQQLQQHQRLSGSYLDISLPLTTPVPIKLTPNLNKWCSESDISELGRHENDDPLQDYDSHRHYDFDYKMVETAGESENFNSDVDDFDVVGYSGLDYMRHFDVPKNLHQAAVTSSDQPRTTLNNFKQKKSSFQSFSGNLKQDMQRADNNAQETTHFRIRPRVRQFRSPTPPQLPDLVQQQSKPSEPEAKRKVDGRSVFTLSSLLGTRNKSLSTESFFEQPNEEGSLYMYGGRKKILKPTPSRNSVDSDLTYVSANAPTATATATKTTTVPTTAIDRSNSKKKHNNNNKNNDLRATKAKTQQQQQPQPQQPPPKLPPPSWLRRGRKSEFLANNNNNKNNGIPPSPPPLTKTTTTTNNAMTSKKPTNKQQQQRTKSIDLQQNATTKKDENNNKRPSLNNTNNNNNKNEKNDSKNLNNKNSNSRFRNNNNSKNNENANTLTKTETTTLTGIAKTTPKSNNHDSRMNLTSEQLQQQHHHQQQPQQLQQQSQLQQQEQQMQQQRLGRSTSRLDISDLESIYGYLKPRKPRSLSLKKIHIHDY